MSDRKPLSKRVRFDVFKRDDFVCQYCGAHPPKAILEVDHITPVVDGGTDDMDNLVTACFACNRGKAANPLTAVPQSLADKAAEIAEREEQLRGYSQVLAARRQRLEDETWSVFHHWRDQHETTHNRFNSVKRFIEHLGLHDVLDAVDIAMAQYLGRDAAEFRYFCGVCWNKIRDQQR